MVSIESNIHNLPGKAESFWLSAVEAKTFPKQSGDITVDVAIVGGGIVGITGAYLLKKAGLRVAVVDARKVLGGVTGHTTAKLTSQHRLKYADLLDKFGWDKAKQYGDANQAAIEFVASLFKKEEKSISNITVSANR